MNRTMRTPVALAIGLTAAAMSLSACGSDTADKASSAATSAASSAGTAASSASPAASSAASSMAGQTSTAASSPVGSSSSTTSAATSSGDKTYTMAVVNDHDNESSCWVAIDGKVYDITSWISQHPGGQGPIKNLCGQDGSSAFNGKHGSDSTPKEKLESFKIGTLQG